MAQSTNPMTHPESPTLKFLDATAAWALIFSAFGLSISSGAMNGTMAIAVIAKLLTLHSKPHRDALLKEITNPNFKGAWLLIALLLVSCLHGVGSFSDHMHYANKYNEWLLIPVFAACIRNEKDWRNLTIAFVTSMMICLALSVLHKYVGLDQLPEKLQKVLSLGPREEPTIFRLRITFGLFMTLAGMYCLLHARQHLIYWIMGLAAWLDTLLLIRSRTAFVTLGIIVVWFFYQNVSKKTALLLTVVTLALAGVAVTQVKNLREGAAEIQVSIQQWSPATTQHARSSEQRLNYWYGALGVIQEAPVFGVGLGGYTSAYAKAVENTPIPPNNNNPHQQYLLIAAQTGLVGLVVFLLSQVMLFKAASGLPKRENRLWVQIILISFAVGNLFNSFLLDSTEGLFFVIMLSATLSRRAYLAQAEKSD